MLKNLKGYTKNHAIKKIPIPSSTMVRCGKTAGLTGDTYLAIVSRANILAELCETNKILINSLQSSRVSCIFIIYKQGDSVYNRTISNFKTDSILIALNLVFIKVLERNELS